LRDHADKYPYQLSGGQKQRAVIARALAKDCPIIVCDEPTGNLDSESSKNIMNLLSQVAENKLVIVVTHNYSEVEPFATRKIRLFDGEVVEDKELKSTDKMETETPYVPYMMSFFNLVGIALRNMFRTPRRTVFTGIVFTFITLLFALIYGLFVSVINNVSDAGYNAVFSNVTENRIIVTNYDNSPLSQDDFDTLLGINRVIDVYEHDVVNDTSIRRYYLEGEDDWQWINNRDSYINPAFVLDQADLLEGRLPENEFEIVVEAKSNFNVGDTAYFGFKYLYYDRWGESPSDNGGDTETIDLDTFIEESAKAYTVVGITNNKDAMSWMENTYFHKDFFYDTDVINSSYFGGNWNTPYQIQITYEGFDILYFPEATVVIDDTLNDNEWVVSRDIIDNMEWMMWELDPAFDYEATPDFYRDLTFDLSSSSTFYSTELEIAIIDAYTPEKGTEYYVVKMNQDTFESLYSIEPYQASVYVKDSYDAKLVQEAIEEAGFNAIYPTSIEDPFTALARIILTVVFGFLMLLLMVIMYFITYFVLRNIQTSKKKDYLIFRSIGASKSSLNKVSLIELFVNMLFSYIVVITILYLNSIFYVVKDIANLFSYYTVGNYVFLFILLMALSLLLGRTFNNRIFNKSVITALKAE
jgi:hypothetical protein